MSNSPLLGVYGTRDLVIEKGQGSYLWDSEHHRYLDCVSGVAVNALGHCHPAIVSAIREQSEKLIHASNLYVLPTQRDLAQRLVELSGMNSVFFSNSGAEANEGAIKFARRYNLSRGETERMEIISFEGSFHGRTYAAMAATGQNKIRDGFGPLPAGFVSIKPNDPDALKKAIGKKTAAIIFEPILAEGGVLDLIPEMFMALKQAQSQGVLLIADEIQTGIWRTGTFLACEYWNLKPDLVTLAKPLGGGLPLGAVLVNAVVAAAQKQGDHGSTFGGNPIACAAGLAVLKTVADSAFQVSLNLRMASLQQGLSEWISEKRSQGHPLGSIRGRGFLIGIPWGGDLPKLLKDIRSQGVLAHRAGTDVLRLLPPLTLSNEEIAELLEALRRVF